MNEAALREVYATIAELWCNPEEVDQNAIRERARRVARKLSELDPAGGAALRRFLESPVCEDYVALFELDPKCPLYLGAHVFDEPKTCAGAAVSDRNEYMIDLVGMYKHFKLAPNGKELPDYLPLVIELLSLTVGSTDPTRRKLVDDYVLPYLPALRARLERLETPYLHLFDAFECTLRFEMRGASDPIPVEATP
jgi:nitrate reductase delta subunit